MPDLGVPSLGQPVPKNWITIEDDFVLIYGVIQVLILYIFRALLIFKTNFT
jgi:hypothetical protein